MNRDYLQEGLEGQDEEVEERTYLGSYNAHVVGVNHYRGMVSNGEMVMLRREPNNPYDSSAVQVLNVQGSQVGHIPRGVVQTVAPLMDQGLLSVEGVVPRGAGNKFKVPICMLLFARAGQENSVTDRLHASGIFPTGDYRAESVFSQSQGGSQGGLGLGLPRPPSSLQPASSGGSRLHRHQVEDSLSRMFDDILAESDTVRRMEPPVATISTPLLPHQQEALAWMVHRENSDALPPFWETQTPKGKAAGVSQPKYLSSITSYVTHQRPPPLRGGILADDMGLGKTLTVLSLIASNRPGVPLPDERIGERAAAEGAQNMHGDPQATPHSQQSTKRARGANTSPASSSSPQQKKRRKSSSACSASEASKFEDSGHSLPSRKDGTATLVVCPLSVMSNWETQIQEHSGGKLSCIRYHGSARGKIREKDLAESDVVLTTYGILASEKYVLKRVQWLRVVLDEGHFIRNAGTKQAKAATELRARAFWVVTGTPIQNSMKDLFGLLAFLRLSPLCERPVFNASLDRPVSAGDSTGLLRLKVLMSHIALRRLKTTTVNGVPLVQLPEKRMHVVKVDMGHAQRTKYAAWMGAGRAVVRGFIASETLLRNWAHVLQILTRLRQICDSTELVTQEDPPPPPEPPSEGASQAQGVSRLTEEEAKALMKKLTDLVANGGLDECPICMDDVLAPVITPCAHVYCKACMESWLADDSGGLQKKCPMCRSPVSRADLHEPAPPEPPSAPPHDENPPNASPAQEGDAAAESLAASSKLTELMRMLRANRASSRPANAGNDDAEYHISQPAPSTQKGAREARSEPVVRSVVFSQFTSMMDIVCAALRKEGIPYVRVDGSMLEHKRAAAIKAFQSSTPVSSHYEVPEVAVMSLKAAGVGLNLTAASQIHLLDPWWNPATEDQAMDRVHRIGQQRAVDVWRYACNDSIEERILALQEQKRELANGALDRRRPEEQQAMRLANIRLLMDV